MKRTIFSLFLITFVVILSADVYPLVFIGGGMTWMKIDYKNSIDGDINQPDSIFGFMVGAALEVDQTAPIIMEYGARYRTTGWSYSEEYNDWGYQFEYESTNRLSFIDIFTKAKYEAPLASNLYLLPYVGYAMGILLTAESKVEYRGNGYSESETEDFKDECNDLNHTLLFGADLLINNKFILGVEYDLGLSNIADSEFSDVTISGFMFKVGILF